MELTVNGDLINVPKETKTVADLLEHLKLDGKVVIVELNGEILHRDSRDGVGLNPKDKIELVHFVGGG